MKGRRGAVGDCAAALAALQRALDHEEGWSDAAARVGPHLALCRTCRERFAAARLLLAVFPAGSLSERERGPVAAAGNVSDRVAVGGVRRRRWAYRAAAMATAAAVVLAVIGMITGTRSQPELPPGPPDGGGPLLADTPPLRLEAELARAATALHQVAEQLPDGPAVPLPAWSLPAEEGGGGIDRAQADAARAPLLAVRQGLEPLAVATQRAWERLRRDLSNWQPPAQTGS